MFAPLDSMKGALCSTPEGTGILINANHPYHLQRFTAAHELGHHRLGHQEAVDLFEDGDDIRGGCRLSGTELEAESFASYFLMPERAVRHALRSVQTPTPFDVYQASLRLQVSYAAMITRLQDLKIITFPQAQQFRDVQPKDIKLSVTHGLTGTVGRRNIWSIGDQDNGASLRPHLGDEVHIVLTELPASGYSWRETPESSAPISQVATDSHLSDGLYGAPSQRHIAYEVTTPAEGTLRLSHSRSWENSCEDERFEVSLTVVASPAAAEGRGLISSQLELLAARARQ